MLIKLTSVCSQFHHHSAPIFFHQKSQSQTVIREKLPKALLYKKGASTMLIKLTPVQRLLRCEDVMSERSGSVAGFEKRSFDTAPVMLQLRQETSAMLGHATCQARNHFDKLLLKNRARH
jgi:hypothetical protein